MVNGALKLKEMVLATLTESDVTVPDDVVEAIVDRVVNRAQICSSTFLFSPIHYTNCFPLLVVFFFT